METDFFIVCKIYLLFGFIEAECADVDKYQVNIAFSHDVKAAILVFQNNETAVMLVYQTNPLGVELFSYVNTSSCFSKFACVLAM